MAKENPSSVSLSSNVACTAREAARRLRRVQISFADEPEIKRRAYIAEKMEQILKDIPVDQRVAFLEEMESVFPVFDRNAETCQRVSETSRADAVETVDGLVNKLSECWTVMSQDERQALSDRLVGAGLIRVARMPVTSDTPKKTDGSTNEGAETKEALRYIAKSLQVEQAGMARVAKTTVMLAVYMVQLDNVVWNAWQTVAPRSVLKRKMSLETALQRYIAGDSSISGGDLNTLIATTKKLLAAFIASIGQLGVQLVRQHLAPFAPQEIKLAVDAKGANLLVGPDAACWGHYKHKARALEKEAVDDAVREIIAKSVTDMMNP